MKTRLFALLVVVFFLVGCQPYQSQSPQLTLLDAPRSLVSGETYTYTWTVDGGSNVEHTNVHTSFTEDFAERIDSDKQSGGPGLYTSELTIETDQDAIIYIKAHAKIDGESYTSEVVKGVIKIKNSIELVKVPDKLLSGESYPYTWKIKGLGTVEHTNIHTSFTPDFEERIDTEKQSGKQGTYSDTLTLESDEEKTVYIKAHANIDGESYSSEVVTKTLSTS